MAKKYEEYDSDDDHSTFNVSQQGSKKDRSYDIIARNCGCLASDLQKCARIRRLKPRCRIYKDIVLYASKGSGGTKVTIQNIYKINRKNEQKSFPGQQHRMLLWHGTSPQAVVGILQSGFRLGVSGFYGGALYFADQMAKSLQHTQKTPNNVGFLFIAEVCLGKVYKAHHGHSDFKQPPAGFDSVKGMGKDIPTWNQNRFYHGAILPCGDTRINTRFPQYDIPYNEYMIYDTNKVIIRFLVECTW